MASVAPLPLADQDQLVAIEDKKNPSALASLEASIIVGDEDEEEKVDQIERVLGQFMFTEQGMSVEQAFKYHNKNADDGLDEDELKSILKKAKCTFSDREFQILMSRYDLDQSGGITQQEFQMTYRVERSALKDFVTLKDEQRAACGQIPLTIAFFLMLLFLVSMHDLTDKKYDTESGLSSELLAAKTGGVKFSTISNIKDYWGWIEGVLVERAFIQHDQSTLDPLPKKDWGFMSRYNKVIGRGVEIAQARSVKESCSIVKLKDAYGHECKPFGKLSGKSFGLPVCDPTNITSSCWHDSGGLTKYLEENLDEADRSGFTAADIKCGMKCTKRKNKQANFAFVLDYLKPKKLLKEQLKYYRQRNWIDEQTVELLATIHTYNAENNIFAQLILSTTFDRGGKVVNSWQSESILADPYGIMNDGSEITLQWVAALDLVWIGMVFGLMIGEFQEMKELGIKYLNDFWNVLDWTQCILTTAIECYWFYIVATGYSLLDKYQNSYKPEFLTATYNGSLDTPERTDVADNLDMLLQHGVIYRYLTIVNILVLVGRFFKAFNVQPRLAVISKTLSKSIPDLAHFLVIFTCLFMTFVMFAHFVFGHIVHSYSTVPNAAYNTLRGFVAAPAVNVPEIIATNSFDIIPRDFVFPMAQVWWVMFMTLLFLVVRSILLAIVLEAYKEAKLHSTHATTMWAQGNDMIRDMISGYRGVIRLGDVQKILEEQLDTKERVNMAMILECYAQNKQTSPKKTKFNFEDSKVFSLVLVKEFFAFREVRLPKQDKLRALSAFARISELDSNFNDVCTRIDNLEQKFGQIHSMLADLKARD